LGFGPDNVPAGAPFLVMESAAFLSLFAIFAAAIFAANAVLRDDDSRMREIVESTPVPRSPFLLARIAGAFLATLTAVACSILGSLLSRPASPAAYAWAFLTMTLPNVLFAVALIFAVARWTRNAIATY